MNPLSFYDRQKEGWNEQEIIQLKNEYVEQQKNISEIADIHKRTPGSIGCRLKLLGILNHHTEAKGYIEYKNSRLYKEIVSTNNVKRSTERSIKKETKKSLKESKINTEQNNKVLIQSKIDEIIIIQKGFQSMLNVLIDIKSDLQKLLDSEHKKAQIKKKPLCASPVINPICKIINYD